MKKYNQLIRILTVLILLPPFLVGCVSDYQERSVDRLPDGCTESSLVHDGLTRWYRICVPDPLPHQAPLVLYLHGGTLSMRSLFSPLIDSSSGWIHIVQEQGVILVVPNGVNPENGDTYGADQGWNDLRPDQAGGQTRVDDVGFLISLLDLVSGELPVDQERIYITGASNGGMMTYRMLLEAPEQFTAGAAFIANLPQLETALQPPDHPVPLLIANGTEDRLMPWGGGVVAKDRGLVKSTRETVDWWVMANQADPNPYIVRDLPDMNQDDDCRIRQESYSGENQGADVWYYEMEGGGHTLPSLNDPGLFQRVASRLLGPVCRDADSVMLAWEFFMEMSSPADLNSP